MKKLFVFTLFIMMSLLVSCDRGWDYNVNVVSSNGVLLFDYITKEERTTLSKHESLFNDLHQNEYKQIDFNDLENYSYGSQGFYKFNYTTNNESIKVKIELDTADKYLLDLIRIAIKHDDELYIYKYYAEDDVIKDPANEPDSIKYFINNSLVDDDLSLIVKPNILNEITIIYWLESSEKNIEKKYKVNSMDLIITLS